MNVSDYHRRIAEGNLGLHLYHLEDKRRHLAMSRIWLRHVGPVNAALQVFADEFVATASRTHEITSVRDSCGSSFTVHLRGTGNGRNTCAPEIVVNLNPTSCTRKNGRQKPWIQYRRNGDTMVHRRLTLRKRETPAQAWHRIAFAFPDAAIQPLAIAA